MSDVMRPLPFKQLMEWVLEEHEKYGSIFGVRRFVKYPARETLSVFNERLEAPYGPAAGPNTQLAQNIIASYVSGARFFELKTVQVTDGEQLSKCISKPCITAADECYNCEWSTELTVSDAFSEYVRAFVACKLLAREFCLGDPDAFVFNMSVGYDLKGIKSDKINSYIDNMKDASETEAYKEAIDWALSNLHRFKNIDADYVRSIPKRISCSVTESTLHGCPPQEIERIAAYLMTEKGLHTFIKCNPTLLGYDTARKILDSLGFDYVAFDDHHFKEDLKWEDAVPMFERLSALARENGVEFGLKLTNTFPVDVKAGELPSTEMYMAGRALFPLTVHLARLISEEFEGRLRISYSGGAVVQNTGALFKAGIWPITMATNILKPGGYERLAQIAHVFDENLGHPDKTVNIGLLRRLDEDVHNDPLYHKSIKPLPDRHIKEPLPLFDCFTAPCTNGCPVSQDIPAYLRAMEENDAETALRIILKRNALPFITGTICPHHCTDKCMRSYYEEGLHIRETKLRAARLAYDKVLSSLRPPEGRTDKRVAIVGGGPAGLSAAFFLTRAGIPAVIFEAENTPGGIVSSAIPEFRISGDSVKKDISLCLAFGAEVRTDTRVSSIEELKEQGFTDVIIAVGASKPGRSPLKYGEAMDAVEFLKKAKNSPDTLEVGKQVAVLGGGNTAMDTARAAKRLKGVKKVSLIYRRTERYMPADEEELAAALRDGVEFMELLSPVGFKDKILTCSVMELGQADASGRRSVIDTGKTVELPADTVIAATGEAIDTSLYESLGITTDAAGRPETNEDLETVVPRVLAAGDCRRGPSTVVEAISDALKAASAIAGITAGLPEEGKEYDDSRNCPVSRLQTCRRRACTVAEPSGRGTSNAQAAPAAVSAQDNRADTDSLYIGRKGVICTASEELPDKRCLGCPSVCSVCTDVCPNRANISIRLPDKGRTEILHVDGMCNECGNCAVFCPYSGAPYRDKFTLFHTEEDFHQSSNSGFVMLDDKELLLRINGREERSSLSGAAEISPDAFSVINAVVREHSYLLR
ncbi:MAG TPA: putative selenate reductase subunit YgfK [Lachnospiraceae bacterium]|nr:putative selenate reductase subunit YgfK [Lachnospiraceae bacterium]